MLNHKFNVTTTPLIKKFSSLIILDPFFLLKIGTLIYQWLNDMLVPNE